MADKHFTELGFSHFYNDILLPKLDDLQSDLETTNTTASNAMERAIAADTKASDLILDVNNLRDSISQSSSPTLGKALTIKFNSNLSLANHYLALSTKCDSSQYTTLLGNIGLISKNGNFKTYSGRVIKLESVWIPSGSTIKYMNVDWYIGTKLIGKGYQCYILTTDNLKEVTSNPYSGNETTDRYYL